MRTRWPARQHGAHVLILFLLGLAHSGLIAILLRSQFEPLRSGFATQSQIMQLRLSPEPRQRTLTARDAEQPTLPTQSIQSQSAGRRLSRAVSASASTSAQITNTNNTSKASNSELAGDIQPTEPAVLDLQIRRDWLLQDKATPQELARSDPRANSVKPTLSEQFALRLGTLECVFQERLPDGRIYRGPGRWVTVQNLHNAVSGGTGSTKLCVRY